VFLGCAFTQIPLKSRREYALIKTLKQKEISVFYFIFFKILFIGEREGERAIDVQGA